MYVNHGSDVRSYYVNKAAANGKKRESIIEPGYYYIILLRLMLR